MDIFSIYLYLAKYHWPKPSHAEVKRWRENEKRLKLWRRDYKRWAKKGIPSKLFWELRPDAFK